MAIQKSIVDKTGTTHSSSYTLISSIVLGTITFSGHTGWGSSVVVYIKCYKDAAARSKGDTSNEKVPFLQVNLPVNDNDVTTYFADGVLDDDSKSPLKQAYTWLKTQNDTVNGVNWTTGTTDV